MPGQKGSEALSEKNHSWRMAHGCSGVGLLRKCCSGVGLLKRWKGSFLGPTLASCNDLLLSCECHRRGCHPLWTLGSAKAQVRELAASVKR